MKILVFLFLTLPLAAWSPKLHEAQTQRALKLIPKSFAQFLNSESGLFLDFARGTAMDMPPTAKELETRFEEIIRMAQEGKRRSELLQALGELVHGVQKIHCPVAFEGAGALRDHYEAYADEQLHRLVVTSEPTWALKGSPDPKPFFQVWVELRESRTRLLLPSFDAEKVQKIGTWDTLSVPFGTLQLSYSNGVNATSNILICLWRLSGKDLLASK